MKFAIIVLIVLAVVSVLSLFIGEFYPVKASGPGWQEFWRQKLGLSRPVFDFFTFLKLQDPYRSWWYQVLLLLLSFSLFACIIERIPIVMRAMKLGDPRGPDEVSKLPASKTFSVSAQPEQLFRRLPHMFRFRKVHQGDEWRLAGSHGALSNLGPILAHTGLLCLALGGLFASLLGFRTTVYGLPGDVLTDPGFNFAVRVDSFKIEYYPLGIGQWVLVDDSFIGKIVGREKGDRFQVETRSHSDQPTILMVDASEIKNQFDIQSDRGNIRDYISVLTVLENGEEVYKHRVEVNKPLRYKGYRFYQTSFDPDNPRVEAQIDSALIVIKHQSDEAALDTVYLSQTQPIKLPDGNELKLARFLPDFRLDGGKAVSASAQLRNPALLLEVYNNGGELYHQWCFTRSSFQHSQAQAAYSFQALDFFGFKASITYPTVLQVNRNPGSWLIWLGFALATLGLILSFYLVHRRLWVVIREKGESRCEVLMGGSTAKNPDLFRQKFERWVQHLKS